MGLAQVKVEPLYGRQVNPDEVFETLELQREEGVLTQQVTASSIKYQSSLTHPGYLEQIDPQGNVSVPDWASDLLDDYQ